MPSAENKLIADVNDQTFWLVGREEAASCTTLAPAHWIPEAPRGEEPVLCIQERKVNVDIE